MSDMLFISMSSSSSFGGKTEKEGRTCPITQETNDLGLNLNSKGFVGLCLIFIEIHPRIISILLPTKPILGISYMKKETTNWYEMHKEAGFKEMTGSLAAAVALILWQGENIRDVARKFNIPEPQLQEAVQEESIADNFDYPPDYQMDYPPSEVIPYQEPQPEKKDKKKDEAPKVDQKSVNIIARTLWAEARNEGTEGMKAVASVIYNRGKGTVPGMISAIKKPYQFSCWNGMDWSNFTIKEKSGGLWNTAKSIATQMANGTFSPTHTYKYYYNPNKASPSWAYDKNGELRPHEDIGNHRFVQI